MSTKRYQRNPILAPNSRHAWEAEAVFNGCPIKQGDTTHLLYRAMSTAHYHAKAKTQLTVSDIGIAESKNGLDFENRHRFIVPELAWEQFGCEDPRVTKLDNTFYIFYTALSTYPPNANGIKIGLAISQDLKTIQAKHLVTPFNAKAMALFPEKINGKIWSVLTVHTDRPPAKICLASFDQIDQLWSEAYWQPWHHKYEQHMLPLQRRPQDQVEVGAPPLKTEHGWLLFYSYIRNYYSPDRLFSIEAVLLDLVDPGKIIARTDFPLLVPEEYYEKRGYVPNVVFPAGAILSGDTISLYYGAADEVCAVAFLSLSGLMDEMLGVNKKTARLLCKKSPPIIEPLKKNVWEAKATFNPAAIRLANTVHIIYRAMSEDNTSVFGYATSQDGTHVDTRLAEPIYLPRADFEQKLIPNGNSGCEDPRLTKLGSKIYMLYTAYDGKNPPRVALTVIEEKDFLEKKWQWAKPVLISPPGLDDKDACLFPEKINGQYAIIHRTGNAMDLSFHTDLNFDGTNWLEEYRWITPRLGWWDSRRIGVATPPIKTKDGWLVLYHGISADDGVYRIGAILAQLDDPTIIISRTDEPILVPEKAFEKSGQVSNVVFPCGVVVIDEKIYLYYGGADQVVAVAVVEMDKLLSFCKQYQL